MLYHPAILAPKRSFRTRSNSVAWLQICSPAKRTIDPIARLDWTPDGLRHTLRCKGYMPDLRSACHKGGDRGGSRSRTGIRVIRCCTICCAIRSICRLRHAIRTGSRVVVRSAPVCPIRCGVRMVNGISTYWIPDIWGIVITGAAGDNRPGRSSQGKSTEIACSVARLDITGRSSDLRYIRYVVNWRAWWDRVNHLRNELAVVHGPCGVEERNQTP